MVVNFHTYMVIIRRKKVVFYTTHCQGPCQVTHFLVIYEDIPKFFFICTYLMSHIKKKVIRFRISSILRSNEKKVHHIYTFPIF